MHSKENGRPQYVYANKLNPAPKDIWHEVLVTDFLLEYEEGAVMYRQPSVVNQHLHPDAEMILSGKLFYIEVDSGTETHTQVAEQLQHYTSQSNLLPANGKHPERYQTFQLEDVFLLLVTSSETRLENLKETCKPVQTIVLLSTLERVINDASGDIWEAIDGDVISILPAKPKPATGIFGGLFGS